MSENVVSLHRAQVQEDIIGGLRNLADRLEAEGPDAYGMPAVTTVAVMLGHSSVTPIEDGELEHRTWWELFSWGKRKDAFTVRGLMATVLKGH